MQLLNFYTDEQIKLVIRKLSVKTIVQHTHVHLTKKITIENMSENLLVCNRLMKVVFCLYVSVCPFLCTSGSCLHTSFPDFAVDFFEKIYINICIILTPFIGERMHR